MDESRLADQGFLSRTHCGVRTKELKEQQPFATWACVALSKDMTRS